MWKSLISKDFFNKYQKLFLGRACMLKECSMCEIKGHELWQEQVNDLARCKAICLTTFWCKGIDFGFNQCFLTREDVRVVGTKFNPMYTAYRVGTCSGDILPINDHYLLKISFTN